MFFTLFKCAFKFSSYSSVCNIKNYIWEDTFIKRLSYLHIFFSPSGQRFTSMHERSASTPTMSQSCCGWPGRASLPLCLQSGSLGKQGERSCKQRQELFEFQLCLYNVAFSCLRNSIKAHLLWSTFSWQHNWGDISCSAAGNVIPPTLQHTIWGIFNTCRQQSTILNASWESLPCTDN